jgi:hypothetical protein
LPFVQKGTVLCLKRVVPQTGKAVVGVWPSAVHCAFAKLADKRQHIIKKQ